MRSTLLGAITNFKIWVAAVILQIQPLNDFVTKYLFGDIGFLKWLAIIMIVDLITGIAKVVKLKGVKAVTSKGLRATISKCLQYSAFLIATHVLTHYQIGGVTQMSSMNWLNKLAYEFVILIEVKSVYENIVEFDSRFDFIGKALKKMIDLLPSKYKNDDKSNKG